MPKVNIFQLYADPDKVVTTAHRGFSGRYPENTLMAFNAAIEAGADLLEFDLRGAKDGVPIVMHDATIDRTTTGTGRPEDYSLAALQQFNASCWEGSAADHSRGLGPGRRIPAGLYPDVAVPTFQQVLDAVPEHIGLNIQVYAGDPAILAEICRLYDAYDLYGRGYLTMSTLADIDAVRNLNDKIDLCCLERARDLDRDFLQRLHDLGIRLLQPGRFNLTPEIVAAARELGLNANVFWANTPADQRHFIDMGVHGILTDHPDILRATICALGLH